MAEGLRTWTSDGKLQMTSERLTREHSVYQVVLPASSTHTQVVSGMVNDGTWIVIPSVSPVLLEGNWTIGYLHEIKITIFNGYFEAHVGRYSLYNFQVIRI